MPSVLCYRQVGLGPFFPSAGEYSDVGETETQQRTGYQLAVVALAARAVNDRRPIAARLQLFRERLVIVREVVARQVDRARHMPQLVKRRRAGVDYQRARAVDDRPELAQANRLQVGGLEGRRVDKLGELRR